MAIPQQHALQPPPYSERLTIPIERLVAPVDVVGEPGVVIYAHSVPLLLNLGQMADLGHHLTCCALVSMPSTRPWDDDPGRVPFASTGRRRQSGRRAPGGAAHGARRSPGAR